VPFLAAFDFVTGCEAWRRDAAQGDGIHPNRNGYAALADFIWQWAPLHSWLTGS
jgi:lysophospholipase L1-like esterase